MGFVQLGISLGKFDALVCPVCDETVFEGLVSKLIEAKAKEMGIWEVSTQVTHRNIGFFFRRESAKNHRRYSQTQKGQEVLIEPLAKNKLQITVI